jgi:signal transduction histidine kinase
VRGELVAKTLAEAQFVTASDLALIECDRVLIRVVVLDASGIGCRPSTSATPCGLGVLDVVHARRSDHRAPRHFRAEPEIVQPLPRASFDPARILQVIGNLLSNAVKFTPSHGSVVVHVERVGDNIVFAVADNGEGIPADKLHTVFERFVQLTSDHRRGGVGLGLYISKCIIEGHGGRIWAENRSGGGSTFSFSLRIDGPT